MRNAEPSEGTGGLPNWWESLTKAAPAGLLLLPAWVALQVFAVTRYDRDAAMVVVAESDPTRLIAGVLVTGGWALTMGGLLFVLRAHWRAFLREAGEDERHEQRKRSRALLAFALESFPTLVLLCVVAIFWTPWVGALWITIFAAALWYPLERSLRRLIIGVLVGVAFLGFTALPWLPDEEIRLPDGDLVAVGMVITDDDGGWVVLERRSGFQERKIVRLDGSIDYSRSFCSQSGTKTAAQALGWVNVAEKCPR